MSEKERYVIVYIDCEGSKDGEVVRVVNNRVVYKGREQIQYNYVF